jgi:hypothetical protein
MAVSYAADNYYFMTVCLAYVAKYVHQAGLLIIHFQ